MCDMFSGYIKGEKMPSGDSGQTRARIMLPLECLAQYVKTLQAPNFKL